VEVSTNLPFLELQRLDLKLLALGVKVACNVSLI